RSVTTGPAVDSLRAIDDGLTGTEWVIVNGLLKAAPGRQVTPEREDERPPEQGASPSLPARSLLPRKTGP
ncbi:MAG TPA: efflux transporter periplasmic adaptor subunit, partial [Candidatus Methylomirabilis sp.]|nr:efflux transporter periplasmic adaptor subunit [Candidatus Methylomirabilis sp.]